MIKMKNNNNVKGGFNFKKIGIIAAAVVVLLFALNINLNKGAANGGDQDSSQAKTVKDNDIIIQVKDITEKPAFYSAEIDGTNLEVIAVKASDGSIRTAFNTCQVCYSSGKGYYKVEGNELVCQNCGNRFGMDDVELSKGGCNPVPITSEYKTVTDETITIPKDFLTQATVIFKNWK